MQGAISLSYIMKFARRSLSPHVNLVGYSL